MLPRYYPLRAFLVSLFSPALSLVCAMAAAYVPGNVFVGTVGEPAVLGVIFIALPLLVGFLLGRVSVLPEGLLNRVFPVTPPVWLWLFFYGLCKIGGNTEDEGIRLILLLLAMLAAAHLLGFFIGMRGNRNSADTDRQFAARLSLLEDTKGDPHA